MSDQVPFVSVVVPALNCVDDVYEFSRAIGNQDYPRSRYEVIVVDNGSNDGTYERLQEVGVTAVRRGEKGRARALNAGIANASGQLILTTDLSCSPEADWISAVVRTFAAYPDAGCVAGEIKLRQTHDNVATEFQKRNNYMSPLLALSRKKLPAMPFADGANASFRRELFDELGGFEESFTKAADVEICYRMFILTKYSLVFNANAIVCEPGEPDLAALLKQRFKMGIGRNLLAMKYPDLYMENVPRHRLKRVYWWLLDSMTDIWDLLKKNLGVFFRDKKDAAIDANIRFVMRLVQSFGRYYGRIWLTWKKISPDPVERSAVREFIERKAEMDERVLLVDEGQLSAASSANTFR